MDKEEIIKLIIVALDAQMEIMKYNMEEHPGLGYGAYHDKLAIAKKWVKENLK